ncbi:hypothetical protein GCM10027347_58710 [Larkinella harenae]
MDKLKTLNDGGYNNLLLVIVLVVGLYLFVNGFNKSKKQTYLDAAGTDVNTQQAQALRDAMNRSGIDWAMSMDGTDVDLIMQTAAKITDYQAVSNSYRTIYGSELTIDLQSELSRTDLQKFYDLVYKRTSGTPTTSAPNLIGKNVKAKEKVNVRRFESPTTVDHQAVAGNLIGTYLGETTLTINGTKGVFVIVESSSWLGLVTNKFYVLKSAVTIG